MCRMASKLNSRIFAVFKKDSSRKINAEGTNGNIKSQRIHVFISKFRVFSYESGHIPSSPGRDSQRPAEISTVRPTFRMMEALNAGKVQPSHSCCVFGILGTMNLMNWISRKQCQQPQHRPPQNVIGGHENQGSSNSRHNELF